MPLKFLVISLGLALIGGTIFIFAAIASKAGKDMAAIHCKDAALKLPVAGSVSSVTISGDEAQVTVAALGKTILITANRCTGKITHTLTIEPLTP